MAGSGAVGEYRRVITGERGGSWGAIARGLLGLVEPAYRGAVAWRNRRFDRGMGVQRVPGVVLSVGNLTTGGTGKTPCVAWLAQWLRAEQREVTLLSRGYGARRGARNDEALELELLLPGVPHVQDRDRVAAARRILAADPNQLILLDDGFQHRRLHRDLDLVLVDALDPFGGGHLLPRGLLREPMESLQRADVVVLSRADQVDPKRQDELLMCLRRLAPQALVTRMVHAPSELRDAHGATTSCTELHGRRVAAFCGIGNPAAFRATLRGCGAEIVDFREFPDHFAFEPSALRALAKWLTQVDAELAVCTLKDLVKLHTLPQEKLALRALVIGAAFPDGATALQNRVRLAIDSQRSAPRR